MQANFLRGCGLYGNLGNYIKRLGKIVVVNQVFQEKAKALNITFVGCGKMGSAMLEGCLKSFDDSMIFNVVKPRELTGDLAAHPQTRHASVPANMADDIQKSDLVIFAVKPQMMNEVCEEWKGYLAPDTPVAHICAGIQLRFLEEYLGHRPYARIMPNTPASVGKGMSGVYFNESTPEQTQELISDILGVIGEQVKMDDESQMDAVTAISGSGPAYVFYFVEHAMQTLDMPEEQVRDFVIKAGQSMEDDAPVQGPDELVRLFNVFQDEMLQGAKQFDFEQETYEALVKQTIIGSAALIEGQAGTPISTLRSNVTSKGGTTAAALNIMMDGDLLAAGKVEQGMMAARDRGVELSELAFSKVSTQNTTRQFRI